MPFTDEFKRIRRRFENLYPSNREKALTFSFEEAFKNNVKPFREKKYNFKKNGKDMFL